MVKSQSLNILKKLNSTKSSPFLLTIKMKRTIILMLPLFVYRLIYGTSLPGKLKRKVSFI